MVLLFVWNAILILSLWPGWGAARRGTQREIAFYHAPLSGAVTLGCALLRLYGVRRLDAALPLLLSRPFPPRPAYLALTKLINSSSSPRRSPSAVILL